MDVRFEPGCGGEIDDEPLTVRLDYKINHLLLPVSLMRFEWKATASGEAGQSFAKLFGAGAALQGQGAVGLTGALRSDMTLPELSFKRAGQVLQVAPSSGHVAIHGKALALDWKIDRVVMLPMPEANARTAALLSGQVDWIEAPAPDAIATIRGRGFTVYSNQQPHVWPWQLSFAEGSPWLDKRVRHAANLCVDHASLQKLLGGMMAVPKGTVDPTHPWWGNPSFDIKYDPNAARKLMADAGFSAAKPVKVKVQISASGSGQMQPLPMNEFVQQSLKQCFFDVAFDVIEWNTLFTNWRRGAKDPTANGAHAINVSFAAMDPFFAMVRFTSTKTFPPVSNNWGYFGNAEFDQLIGTARTTFDDKARDAALAQLHKRIVEEAPFVWIAHDVGPRAMSSKVKGVVQPRSWFIDIAPMSIQ